MNKNLNQLGSSFFFVGENVCPDGIGVYDPAISAATTTAALPSAGCFCREILWEPWCQWRHMNGDLFSFFSIHLLSIMFDE